MSKTNESYSDDFYEDDDYYDDLEYTDDSDSLLYYDQDNQKYIREVDEEENTEEENDYDEYDYEDTYEDTEYETKPKKKYYLKDNIKAIIFIVLVIILVFILLMFFKSTKSKKVNNNINDVKIVKKIINNNDNMFKKMKDASLTYFTKEKLESENSLSLSKMNELGLIDNIDSKYNQNDSVATIDNKKLKIELVTNDKKDTKTYIVDNYIYCKDTYLCEKSSTMENKSYEYTKEGEKHLSNWSAWTDYEETSCDIEKINCDNKDTDCLTEIRTKTSNSKSETKTMTYQTSRSAFRTITKEVGQICSNYDYVKINGIYYRTEKNSNYKSLGEIKKTTQASYYNWKYNGRKKYHTPPSDTINTRYVFVEADYSKCGNTCNDNPDYYYDSYTFTKDLVRVSNTTSDCNTYITKVIPNYVIEEQKVTVSRDEKENVTVCYKSERTRTVTQDEDEIKWSNYNDEKLLNSGYNYTGQIK